MTKEELLRKWYRVGPSGTELDPEPPAASVHDDILYETDSDKSILMETDSEAPEVLHDEESDGVLLETGSEAEVEEPPQKRRYAVGRSNAELSFLGKPVCQRAHVRLYGIGPNAMQNMRQGLAPFTMHESRETEPKHPVLGVSLKRKVGSHCKWQNVLSFFFLLWSSCAEILPIRLSMPRVAKGLLESHVSSDVDFKERYVRSYMSTLERNYDLNLVPWTLLWTEVYLVRNRNCFCFI